VLYPIDLDVWRGVLDRKDAEVGRQWIAEGESLVRDLQAELPQFRVVLGFRV
jgi:hypothetical protein